ncbi:hypothetical protein CKM354_001012300 [Cercospora kikuchii]|uniref:Carrier domain-containing protein n=1 Tax=Cercospora kikuchii TaxID=84275 RepID=A0A9P3CPL9_9PEZI|nr:uncharacterized protein CKM354_001012300 [Cercospora kikuchii]GIZ47022.1 hypothetical protein CKM354_001012300 [Cercospora kikuchii]
MEGRRDILQRLGDEALLGIAAACEVEVDAVEDVYPCSPWQRAAIAGSMKQSNTFFFRSITTIPADMDPDRICEAFHTIMRRNAVLRTRIVDLPAGIFQVVLRNPPAFDRTADLEEYLRCDEAEQKQMGLGAPLLRLALIERTLVITIHHSIYDITSSKAWLEDVAKQYRGQAVEQRTPYENFIDYLSTINEEMAQAFWKGRFSDTPSIYPALPEGHVPLATNTTSRKIACSALASRKVAMSQIPFYVEVAWAMVASTYTSSDTIAFGQLLSGRVPRLRQLANTLGPIATTIPVQVKLDSSTTIAELIKIRARERRQVNSNDALHYDMAKIRAVSEEARVASSYQTIINVDPHIAEGRDGETGSQSSLVQGLAPYCLSLAIQLAEQHVVVDASYDPRVMDERQIQRALHLFEYFLQTLTNSPPTLKVGDIPRVSPQDLSELFSWNSTFPEPVEQSLHGIFQAQSSLVPQAKAVDAWDGSATYAELTDMTTRLAKHLVRKGLVVGDRVAVLVDRSLLAVVSLLAVQKAGGCCVPINMTDPLVRKALVIGKSGAKIVLTSMKEIFETSNEGVELLRINLDAIKEFPHSLEIELPTVSANELAYLLFTSGSTGTPKGVMLEHRSLATALTSLREPLGLAVGDRHLQFASLVWDISLCEIFGALLFGSCVCIPSNQDRESGLAAYIRDQRIDFAISTPTLIRTLSPSEVPALRRITSIGEVVDPNAASIWGDKIHFVNAWGPCESSIMSTCHKLTPDAPFHDTIGRPLGCAVWITDPADPDKLAAIGSVGELLVEGVTVARGYMDEPAKTAAAFIQTPIWAKKRSVQPAHPTRFYRTGDLARYYPDGTISFIGRQDNQVKIRGVRFELDEVEHHIVCQSATVRDAMVTVHSSAASRKDVVAILSFNDHSLPSDVALGEIPGDHRSTVANYLKTVQAYIDRRLPSYMVPRYWLVVQRLPRTVSEKLDRTAIKKWVAEQDPSSWLPPDQRHTEPLDGLTSVSTARETAMRAVWSSVLSIPESQLHRERSFIALGGDSITAMQAATRLRKAGYRISVASLLLSKSLAEAAEKAESIAGNTSKVNTSDDVAPVADAGPEGISTNEIDEATSERLTQAGLTASEVQSVLPCTPMQEGILFAQARGTEGTYLDRIVFKVTFAQGQEKIDVKRLGDAWNTVCSANSILRTTFTSGLLDDGAFQQVVLEENEPEVAYSHVSSLMISDSNDTAALLELPRSMFQDGRPAHHLLLIEASETLAYMVLDISHALADATSIFLLGRQLAYAYGIATRLPESLDFAHYVSHLRNYDEASSQAYWREYLSGVRPCLMSLPSAASETSGSTNLRGAIDDCILNVPRINAFCHENETTVASLLQVAWSLALGRYTGCPRVCYGYVFSDRHSVDGAAEIVGPLISMLPVKCDIVSDSISALLATTQEDFTRSIDHPHCSLHAIQGSSSTPLFNTALSIQKLPPQNLAEESAAIEIEIAAVHDPTEYAMVLNVAYDEDVILCRLNYQKQQISDSVAHEITGTVKRALAAIMAGPAKPSLSVLREITPLPVKMTPFDSFDSKTADEVRRLAAAQCELVKSAVEDVFPCTALQTDLLASSVHDAPQSMKQYVTPADEETPCDDLCAAFEVALSSIPALRTRIVNLNSHGHLQVVTKPRPQWAESEDLQEYLAWDQDIGVRYGGQLCRLGRIEQEDGHEFVVLSVHSAVADRWTVRKCFDIVDRALRGEKSPKLLSMAGIVHSLNDANLTANGVVSWAARLEHHGDAARFPTGSGVTQRGSSEISTAALVLDNNLHTVQNHSALLQAAWALCLSRRTGQSKVLFGVCTDGRDSPWMNAGNVSGGLGTVLPYALNVSHEDSFQKLLDATTRYSAEASMITHSLPGYLSGLDKAEKEMTAHVLSINQRDTQEHGPVASVVKDVHTKDADLCSFDLMIDCIVGSEATTIEMRSIANILDARQLDVLIHQYEHAIKQMYEALQEEGSRKVSATRTMSDYEIELLRQWNSRNISTEEGCLHTRIAHVSKQQANAPAVCSLDAELSYTQLDSLSERVARRLREVGVREGQVVPFLYKKSASPVVIMLGILKAGGVVLGLDSKSPTERLQEICRDACASVIICASELQRQAEALSSFAGILTLDLDMIWKLPESTEAAAIGGDPSNLAYVIYTSGSTGKPKGIKVRHSNIMTSLTSHLEPFGINTNTRMLQISSFAFDMSIVEIFQTLLGGGCICVPTEEERLHDVEGAVSRTQANFMYTTPSLARLMDPSRASTLQTLVLMGESLTMDAVELWHSRLRLMACYGPAETAALSSCTDVRFDQISNLGLPNGCKYWVVDENDHNSLLPVGRVGELLIEGPIVSAGYIQDVEKTAEAFIQSPTWTDADLLMKCDRTFYKTGDLVIQNADGSVAHCGRKDLQVKVRGHRIELGEIEHHIRKNFVDWHATAQLVRPQDDAENALLVVFLTGTKGGSHARADSPQLLGPVPALAKAMRKILSGSLPPYMVPDIFVPLSMVPLNASGKTDRRLLKALSEAKNVSELLKYSALIADRPFDGEVGTAVTEAQTHSQPLLTPDELVLRQLWSDVLVLPESSITKSSDWLASGGNSLKAIQLAAKARRQKLPITAVDVIRHPTLRDMARLLCEKQPQTKIESTPADTAVVKPYSLLSIDAAVARSHAARSCSVTEGEIEDIYPCTPMQRAMMSQTLQRSGDYVAQWKMVLPKHVEPSRFAKAWTMVSRHMPALRTSVVDIPGQGLVQVVHTPSLVDELLPEDGDADESGAVAVIELGAPLSQARLRRCRATSKYQFDWTAFHGIYDGWSASLILEALSTAYKGQDLPSFTPFQPFVEHTLSVSHNAKSEAFWRKQFEGIEVTHFPPLPEPSYLPRPDSAFSYDVENLHSPTQGVTLPVVLRAAWATLLASYTGTTETIFGVVVNGREIDIAGIERMPAPTLATVPVRIAVPSDLTVGQLLGRVQKQTVEMLPWQQTGLRQIAKASPESEEACRFQTLLLVQPQIDKSWQTANGEAIIESVEIGSKSAAALLGPYAIVLECEQHEGGKLHFNFSFDAKVIGVAQISRIARQLAHILREMCQVANKQSEDTTVAMVKAAGDGDLQQIWQWNDSVPETVDECVHHLIAKTFERQPDAPAICAWDGSLTYSELNAMSTQLAQYLVQSGVGPGKVVPLLFEKSMWNPVVALATIKAGGTSLMLDASLPKDRLATILEQVDITVLLSSKLQYPLAESISEGAPVIVVDHETMVTTGVSTSPLVSPREPSKPSDTLYLCFTSGSTGRPKGIMTSHANFSSALRHQSPHLNLTSSSRVFDFSSYSWDMAWYNLLHTLYAGGCLCIPSDSERKEDLPGSMIRLNSNWIATTPTVASLIDDDALQNLAHIEVVGETPGQELLARLKQGDRLRHRNIYGPSECTVVATGSSDMRDSAHIGWCAGLVPWIADPDTGNHLTPIGCVGELWLEGPLVSQGYIGQPQLSEASFVDTPPFAAQGSPRRYQRMYRTGDLVRYEPDGSLSFLGRKDAQVKIRGQRLELSEVEFYCRRLLNSQYGHQAQAVAAELVKPHASRKPALALFILPEGAQDMAEEDVIRHVQSMVMGLDTRLAEVVPSFMVPSMYLPLRDVPISATGKLDRRELRKLGQTIEPIQETKGQPVFAAPATEKERVLQELWAKTLALPVSSISVDARWSDIGGDSLTAMQVIAAAHKQQIELKMGDLLRFQTIRRLAAAAVTDDNEVDEVITVFRQVEPVEPEERVVLSPVQQWYLDNHSSANGFDITVYLKLKSETTPQMVRTAIEKVITRHEMLRARFERDEHSRWTQYFHEDHESSYGFQVATAVAEENRLPLMQDCCQKSNLQEGRLLSAIFFDGSPTSSGQDLFVTLSHLVSDYWSWRAIVQDLEHILAGKEFERGAPTSFLTWVRAQERFAKAHLNESSPNSPRSQLTREMSGYWKTAGKSTRVVENVHISAKETSAIVDYFATKVQARPIEIIVAALTASFAQAFPDRAKSLPPCYCTSNGRDAGGVDLSRTVGWFTSVFPVQVELPEGEEVNLQTIVQSSKAAHSALPRHSWSHLASKYYSPQKQQKPDEEVYELFLNFLGDSMKSLEDKSDSMFQIRPTPEGARSPASSDEWRLGAIFEISGHIAEGGFVFSVAYTCEAERGQRFVRCLRETLHQMAKLAD